MTVKPAPRIAPSHDDIVMDRIFVIAAHAILKIYDILGPELRVHVAKIEARLLRYDERDQSNDPADRGV